MTGLATFLLLLPFATWWWGNALGLVDGAPVAATLRRTAWRTVPFVAVAAWQGPPAALPMAAALLGALAVHGLWQWTTVRRSVAAGRAPDGRTPLGRRRPGRTTDRSGESAPTMDAPSLKDGPDRGRPR